MRSGDDVQQNEVGRVGGDRVECLDAVLRRADATGQALQIGLHQLEVLDIVIDQKD
jgi:hypothetical protein